MSAVKEPTLRYDPLYHNALQHLQAGEWEVGLAELNQLVEKYPLVPELRSMRQEMQIRSRIDDYETEERAIKKRKRTTRKILTTLALVAALLLVAYGAIVYASRVQEQISEQIARFSNETEQVQIALTFRNGQNLLQAGKADLALAQFQKVAAEDPSYADLDYFIKEAERQAEIEEKYLEAGRLVNLQDYSAALVLYQEIQKDEPYYKDVQIQIESIGQNLLLTDLMAQAEMAYTQGDWETAATGFETIRSIDPSYQKTYLEDRLYNSYMSVAANSLSESSTNFANLDNAETNFRKALALRPQTVQTMDERDRIREQFKQNLAQSYLQAAEDVLSPKADSMDALVVAEDYYRRALALQPNEPQIEALREMARNYIKAQTAYQNGDWGTAVDALQYVFELDPDFAAGTARQSLYEALMQRGRDYDATGAFTDALSDFQNAAATAATGDNFFSGVIEAELKVAEVLGRLGEYEQGISVYQSLLNDIEALVYQGVANPALDARRAQLDSAASYANLRYYRSAYRVYADVIPEVLPPMVEFTHTVESGEYLTQIAKDYGTTVEKILEANKLGTSKRLRPGQQLIVPGAQTETP